jgi:hypothetical protein
MKRLAFALFLLAPAARADIFDAAAIAGAAGDIVTTEVGLHRGYVEQNIQNRPLRIGMNVALTSTCLLAARHYEKEGHRGWAKVLKLVPFAVFGGAAVKNLHTMRNR